MSVRMGVVDLRVGDCRTLLREIPTQSIHCCITSPPYWGLRNYQTESWEGGKADCQHIETDKVCSVCGAVQVDYQIGQEPSPEEYVEALLDVFQEIKRTLRDDGTLWLNLGDCYVTQPPGRCENPFATSGLHRGGKGDREFARESCQARPKRNYGLLKSKDLVGIPWRVAFALQDQGWYLRSDIIWAKSNPMPESVTDRPTRAHEYLFLFSKSERYFYDQEAIKEEAVSTPHAPGNLVITQPEEKGHRDPAYEPNRVWSAEGKRNRRDVWSVPLLPYHAAHFAVFPPALIEPCILAGTSAYGACSQCGSPWNRDAEKKWQPTCECQNASLVPCRVLDPFAGSGTTGEVARRWGRDAILLELNPDYAKLVQERTSFGVLDLLGD